MAGFITSADAVFTITIQTLYSAPIALDNWGADRAWEVAEVELAETRMSMDGRLNIGFIPNPVDMTLTFSANSDSIPVFETLLTASRANRTAYALGGEMVLNSNGRRYTFVNGVLRTASFAPNAGRTLEDRAFGLRWENVLPAGI